MYIYFFILVVLNPGKTYIYTLRKGNNTFPDCMYLKNLQNVCPKIWIIIYM